MTDEMRISFGSPLRVSVHTDVGRVRANNEDSHGFAWLADSTLFVIVADGMGGHEAGEVASGLAVQVLEEVVSRDVEADPRERLYHGLLEANEAILQEGRASGTRGMGTTAVAMLCKGWQAYVGLVGDSRLYHFRNGHLVWRTLDHTRVQMLIDQGEVPEAEAKNHVEAGMLTRALGHAKMADGRPLEPDVLADPLAMAERDALVICSDGLHDLLEDWEIGQVVAGREPGEAVAELVRIAVERGGHDNVTVAVVVAGDRCGEYDPAGIPSQTPQAPGRSAEPATASSVTLPPEAMPPAAPTEYAPSATSATSASSASSTPAQQEPVEAAPAPPVADAQPAHPDDAAPTPAPAPAPPAPAPPPAQPAKLAPSGPVTLLVGGPIDPSAAAPAARTEAAGVLPVPMAAPPPAVSPRSIAGAHAGPSDVTVATEIAPAQPRLPASQLATLTLPTPPEPTSRPAAVSEAAAAPPVNGAAATPAEPGSPAAEDAPAPAPAPADAAGAAGSPVAVDDKAVPVDPPAAAAVPRPKPVAAPSPLVPAAGATPEPRRSRLGLWIGLGVVALVVVGGAVALFAVVVLGAGATWFAM